ncbi:MAG: hypothetical protein IH945_00140 [Armatimonadetes bacterium]|nr:hypothetical protein [Armatimonadota bacterium]
MGEPLGLDDGIRIFWQGARSIAPHRFDSYIETTNATKIEALARHSWNVALCQSLFPALHACELTLRNAFHDALADKYNTHTWMVGPMVLKESQQEEVNKAIQRISSRYKSPTPGRIVAELSFGFWVRLLFKDYTEKASDPLIARSFKHSGNTKISRQLLNGTYADILELRNRAYHLEAIWNRPDLALECDDIWEAVAWINPVYAALARKDCTVRQVLADGFDRHCTQTKALIQAKVDRHNTKIANGDG